MSKTGKIELTLNQDDHKGDGNLVLDKAKPKVKPPSMYKVIIFNDDFTPMEFVVEVLETFFNMNREKATQIMLAVHTKGQAVCGVYTRDIAETKMTQVNQFASDNEHPLLSGIDRAD